ncbi:MAG: hypothetical protein LC770_11795 [Acidobacteria bacterium]|nr:hypothetical protein [Acidobacteriota bacterium]
MKDHLKPQMNTEKHRFKHGEITDIEVGLLLNFGLKPQFKRLIFDNPRKSIRENPCLSVAALLSSDVELNQ